MLSLGSAVIAPLSLKKPEPSWIRAIGSDQVLPPSTEFATSMPLVEPLASNCPVKESASAQATPFGAIEIQALLVRA